MTDFDFDRAVASRDAGDGRRAVTVTDGWDTPNQTRNGGYVLAMLTEAVRHASAHPDILNVSVNFLRPHPVGEAIVESELVRSGRRTATVTGRLLDEETVTTLVTATFVDRAAQQGYTHPSPSMPALPPPEKCLDLFAEVPAGTIKIADHFEYRHAEAPGWSRGAPSGRMEAVYWTRFADGREPDDLALVLIPDAYPPVTAEIGHLASATVQMTVTVFRRPVAGWLLSRVRTRHVIDGFHDEDVELWDSSGHLVAQSRQVAILP